VQDNKNKTIWRRIGIIAVLLPVCFFFPFMLLVIGWLIWTIYQDLKTPSVISVPPAPTWRDVKAGDEDWLSQFCTGCESPAEEQFLRAMVTAFNLTPDNGKLISPTLTLEIQVSVGNYRFDFLANGRQVIEIDGAAWHSSPEQKERDRIRDEFSVGEGYSVLRIPAKVVFNTPDQAISQVKDAIAATPRYTRPVKPQSAAPRKSFSQHLSTIADGVNALDRFVDVASTKQKALAEFKSAIRTEQMLLEALVSETERDISRDAMPPLARKNYENLKAKLEAQDDGNVKVSREEIYRWKTIIQPAPNDDLEIQGQIEREYQHEMVQRHLRMTQLKQRCANDPDFARRFRLKVEETNFPEADVIFGV
jgi:very-short-patch-repair endonuclease